MSKLQSNADKSDLGNLKLSLLRLYVTKAEPTAKANTIWLVLTSTPSSQFIS